MPIRRHHRWLYRSTGASCRPRSASGVPRGAAKPAGGHTGAWSCTSETGGGETTRSIAGVIWTGRWVRRLKPLHSLLERTRTTRVVLATAHRDHDPTNNDASNLAALCQRCHILHDKDEHLRRRRLTDPPRLRGREGRVTLL